MVNSSLNEYVRAQLQHGYQPMAIRTALLQAGYNPQDIDFALRMAAQPARRIEISGRNLAIALVGILAIALLVFAGFILFTPAAKDIQLSLRIGQTELNPGGDLSVTASLSSAQKRTVPVELSYVVVEKFTRKTITSRSDSIDLGLNAINTQNIPLPEAISSGDYEVRLTAKYESLSRIQSVSFTVTQPVVEEVQPQVTEELKPIEAPTEEETPECPPSCDDLNPATDDSCVRGACVHVMKKNFCGNGECEEGENKLLCPADCGAVQDKEAVKQEAINRAMSDPEKAAMLCSGLIIPEAADPCFAAIANASKKSALCLNIQDLRARDNCLMEFAFSGDYTVCDQLNNGYFITSCQSLARFSSFPTTQEEIDQEIKQASESAEIPAG